MSFFCFSICETYSTWLRDYEKLWLSLFDLLEKPSAIVQL